MPILTFFLRRLMPFWSLALATIVGSAAARELPPIELFFDQQSVQSAVLSPDGTKVAMIAPNKGRYSIAVMDTKTGEVAVPVHFKDENIRSVFWKGSDRLLFTSAIAGHEVLLLASVDLNGKSLRRILEPRRGNDDFSLFFGNLVDRFPASDEHILITGYTAEHDARRINPSIPINPTRSVYRVNVKTARRMPVVGLDRGVAAGWFDRDGNQRLTTQSEGVKTNFRVRERNDQPWRTIRTFDAGDERWQVAGMHANGETAYIIDNSEEDRGVLRGLNVRTGEFTTTLFNPPAGQIQRIIQSPGRERLLGVVYEDVVVRTHWLDPQWAGIMNAVETQFPGQVVLMTSMSDDEKRFVFRVFSDRDPGRYLLGEMGAGGLRLQGITAVRPAIKPGQMAPMLPIKYTARDGLEIHGYLTKPLGSQRRRTPLLVMPHGGPFGPRDSWDFIAEVQFLANRGYAVLQPNFRGSGGYGRAYEEAGYRQWGLKMQDDLTDGVKWAVGQGYADPDRVAIYGASYGGYAALAGLVYTPELYVCGVNYVGVSDLTRIQPILNFNNFPKPVQEFMARRWLHPFKDSDQIRATSPVNFVQNIRVPLLMAYGEYDPRVTIDHGQVLEAALKKHGKQYKNIVVGNEGHGFRKFENRMEFYRQMDAFFAKYLRPKAP